MPDNVPPLAESLHTMGSVLSALGLRWHLLRSEMPSHMAASESAQEIEKCLSELQSRLRRLIESHPVTFPLHDPDTPSAGE